jgi:hypothetical protein
VRQEPIRVKNISVVPLWGKLLALPTNISLGSKGLPGIKNQA